MGTEPNPSRIHWTQTLFWDKQNRIEGTQIVWPTEPEPNPQAVRSTNRTELNPNFSVGFDFHLLYVCSRHTTVRVLKNWTLLRFWIISIYMAQNLLYVLHLLINLWNAIKPGPSYGKRLVQHAPTHRNLGDAYEPNSFCCEFNIFIVYWFTICFVYDFQHITPDGVMVHTQLHYFFCVHRAS